MKFLGITLLLSILMSFSASSANVPVEEFAKLPSTSMMALSPSAERVAFRLVKDGRDFIMVRDLKTGQFISGTDASGINPTSLYFVTEDKVILGVEQNIKLRGYSGRHDMSAAFVLNVETRKVHQLLAAGFGIYDGQTSLGRILGISEDGKWAYMPAWRKQGEFSLLKVSLERRRKPGIYQKGTADTIDYFLNQKGEVVARERYNNRTNIHRIQAKDGRDWIDIFEEKTKYITKSFTGVTPDGKKLVVRKQHEKTGRWSYYTMELSNGELSEPLFSYDKKDVEGVITGVDNTVFGVTLSGFSKEYEFFDKKLNARMRGMKKVLPGTSITIADFTEDMEKMLFYIEGGEYVGEYFLYANGSLDFLGSSRPTMPLEAVSPIEVTEYKARDGIVIPTLLTHPRVKDKGPKKTILLPHGGPETYDKLRFDYMAQYFAAQGFLVIQPQFRGSTGFGPTHVWLGRGEWGRAMQDDLTDAVNHYVEQGLVDKDNVCIVGASYGGYAALAGATFTPELYKCVISINGISDVERMVKTDRRDYGRHHQVVAYWEEVIANGDFDDDHLESISPINFAKNVSSPVLLIHGQYDEIVKVRQSRDMFDELEDLEKDVTFVELKKGNHHLSNAENRMQALQAIDVFLKKHIN